MKSQPILVFLAICELSSLESTSSNDISENFPSINWPNTIVRATAPEGNLTQGEIVFSANNTQFLSGFGVDVFKGLQISLGFQVQVVTAKGWATQYPNGSWFGMARQILDNEADLSLAKTSILPYRAQALAYLVPTHGLGLYAFFVQPSSSSARNIFLDPFSPSLWITFVITVFLLTFSLKILSLLLHTDQSAVTFSIQDNQLMKDCGIWAFYAVSQHGFYSSPHIASLRIILLIGIIFTLIVYVSFSAQLVTMFAIQSVPIKSMRDLLSRSEIRITIDMNNRAASSIFEETASNTTDKVALALQQRSKSSRDFFIPASEGGLLVLQAKGAFLTFKDTFYTTITNMYGPTEDEICSKVSSVPVTDAKFRSGLFVAKDSPLKEAFNIKLIAMYTSGLMKRFVSNYEATYTPDCNGENGRRTASFPVIDMTDVIFAFYELVYGTVSAVVFLLIEFLFRKFIRTSELTKTFHANSDISSEESMQIHPSFKRFC